MNGRGDGRDARRRPPVTARAGLGALERRTVDDGKDAVAVPGGRRPFHDHEQAGTRSLYGRKRDQGAGAAETVGDADAGAGLVGRVLSIGAGSRDHNRGVWRGIRLVAAGVGGEVPNDGGQEKSGDDPQGSPEPAHRGA